MTTEYRVIASCSSIDRNTEVREVLDAPLYPGKHSDWFSTVNKVYTSPWTVSPFAESDSRTETRSTI